jgi:integrase
MVWTPPLAGAFLDHVESEDPALYPLYLLILYRGLRRGEACGLRDQDVDLEHGQIAIAQSITTVGYQIVVQPVKTAAAQRTLPLAAGTVAALLAYRQWREDRRLNARAWPDTGLFFVQADGAGWHPKQLTDRFDQLVTASGLPPVRLHDLRHCAATYLHHAGGGLTEVQETLGHASMEFTANAYISVLPERHELGATAAADLIPRHDGTLIAPP